jgi:hypothetical protein
MCMSGLHTNKDNDKLSEEMMEEHLFGDVAKSSLAYSTST